MNPRMKENGTPVKPDNNFQIRNPWTPQTPGNPIPSRSNGISIDGGNQSGKRKWTEFFKLLDQQSKATPNSNTAGGNYNFNKPLNQSNSSYGVGGHQMENGIMHAKNFSITGPANQISSSNGTVDHIGGGLIRGGHNANFSGTRYQINSSNNMGDYQMGSQTLHGSNNSYLTGPRNQIIISSDTGNHMRNGIIRGGGNSNFIGILNQNSSSNSIGNHHMENKILQGGNNFKLTMQMNQITSPNGAGNYKGNGIIQSGNHCSNVNGTLNQISSFKGMDDHHQFENGIVRGGNYIDLTGPTNQIGSSNGTGNNIGYEISRGSSSSRFIGTQNEISSSNTMGGLTGHTNQISSSNGTSNNIGYGISRGSSGSRFIGTQNETSSSNSMGNHGIGNQISQGGNNFNVAGNQVSSSNGHIQNGTMRDGNNSNFTGLLNSIVDHRIGNENLGHCFNSQTQTFHIDNSSSSYSLVASNRGLVRSTIPQPTFPTMNTSPTTILRTDSVIPSPLPNLNMQPLRAPRDINSSNAPLVLNSYSEVDSSWTEGNFTSLLLGDEIPDLNPNNNGLNAHNSLQLLKNGFHGHTLANNNLNSPARRDDDAGKRNANSFPFAPITPDHANLLEKNRQAEMLKFLVDDGSCQDHDRENLLSSIGNEAIENHCNQLLQTIVSSSSTVVSTPQAENKITEERSNQDVIDLNETPKQKTPKRRKHRPKVVKEGKPKRTPKPKTPTKGESEENPPRKRKYVRKNKAPEGENATPLQTDAVDVVKVPTFKSREESCRKRLNFDFEISEKQESQYKSATVQVAHHQGNQPVLDLNLNYPANQMPVESLAGEESHASRAPSGIINYNTSNEIARNLRMEYNENRVDQDLRELNKSFSRANFNPERSKVMRWKSTHQMVERDVGNFKGFCESKAEETLRTEQVGPSSEYKLGSPTMCLEPIRSENKEPVSPNVGTSNQEACKKQKMDNDFQTALSGPEKEQSTDGTYGENIVRAEKYVPWKLTALDRKVLLAKMRERKADISTQVQSTGYLADIPNSNLQSAITSKNAEASGYQQQNEKCQAPMQNSRQITPNPCRVIAFCSDKVPLQELKDTSHLHRQKPVKARGPPKTIKYSKKMVDEITNRLQCLTISGDSGETSGTDKFALIPYEGGGAMVAYEPKKRKPRPKVDLDPETTRIWNLLMGKEGSEASEAENKDKEKWWKEERRVFHGRAESFIARMHLVQGDRRFSPWKGSVVDSIIGVFLTQNVSDQLSSSAFMALAAQFPLCSITPDQTSDQSGTSILTEEPGIQGLTPCNTTGCSEKVIRQPFYRQSSETYLGSSGTGQTGLATEPKRITMKNASSPQNSSDSSVHHINGEIQSSSGSSSEVEDSNNGGQSIKNNGLTSVQHENSTGPLQVENNLNTVPPLSRPIHSSISSMQNSTKPPSYFQMLMAAQVPRSELNCFEISREECRSSFPSRAPEMTGKNISNWDDRVGHVTSEMMAKPLYQQNGMQNGQPPNTDLFGFLTNHLTVQEVSAQQVPQIRNDPLSLNTYQVEKSWIYESKEIGFNNLSKPDEPVSASNSSANQTIDLSKQTEQAIDVQEGTTEANKQVFLGDITTDGNAREQIRFPDEVNTGIHAKTLKGSQKHEKEKKPSFDWDSLRKMAQTNVTGKENSMDASDSMDYEAMRCADVNVISDSIRMRGMNHMLAERIKAFLNRVVTDHGSINLEWLRDVPPDKAKDYLLSIRGLGLKSVECVRLLTLHHLAFPVDTNVGRIAVRLGWVPIQPLPESLQLHLLEMYPVLESVQKYLWPRLCKLDQKTLYELHYQLITFGKVFCTKSKPNCNACPMRGECRHFASAFASARLALPAPEEKGIVSSTMPIATERRADGPIKPLLLQPSNSTGVREQTVSSCEPIIEEPASPEPDIAEITEADIEDAFYEEDPDEIPTIRLNVEQLTVNLRNFMEEHMDLEEGDMSKALVALTPEVASIPMPKLKYILRLRTERQVYVLPDSHPLIKRLDKREPDDPSPYLLALLAPGEEASSGQPSGRGCESKGSVDMTNEKDCSSVNEEANSLTVRGTLLIPCRTAMRGSFPLNGTYFQVNEVFADHESSINPIDVPRKWLWNLEKRTVFFGTSATSIFRGMTTKEIQNSFWRGFVCVRGFDQKTRAPRPLNRNLHVPQGKTVKAGNATL